MFHRSYLMMTVLMILLGPLSLPCVGYAVNNVRTRLLSKKYLRRLEPKPHYKG